MTLTIERGIRHLVLVGSRVAAGLGSWFVDWIVPSWVGDWMVHPSSSFSQWLVGVVILATGLGTGAAVWLASFLVRWLVRGFYRPAERR